MAKYEGTYACGHDGVVNVIGKMRDRQRKIDYAFSHLCPQCAKKEREKQIAEENIMKKCYPIELVNHVANKYQDCWNDSELLERIR